MRDGVGARATIERDREACPRAQRRSYRHGVAWSPFTGRYFSRQLRSTLGAVQRCLDFNAMGIDAHIVHCHTWYSHCGGILAQKNYGVPLVVTVHSLEPLRPWKREQLGGGYDLALWLEKTTLET